jgi:hypothetical protein
LMNSEQKHTTETQRTQRLHREERHRDFLCKAATFRDFGAECARRMFVPAPILVRSS